MYSTGFPHSDRVSGTLSLQRQHDNTPSLQRNFFQLFGFLKEPISFGSNDFPLVLQCSYDGHTMYFVLHCSFLSGEKVTIAEHRVVCLQGKVQPGPQPSADDPHATSNQCEANEFSACVTINGQIVLLQGIL